MNSDKDHDKWAANIAFVGKKESVKEIIKNLNTEEEAGNIDDLTLIEGPYTRLQDMLKDRKENLLLDSNSTKSLPGGEISHHNNSNKQDGQLEIDFESFDSDIEEDFDEKDDDFDYDEDDGFDDEN